jgi:anti-sigma regulatory factor (Ser/Thr protein kinase)
VTDFAEVDLNRVLDDTLQLLEPQLRHGRIELAREYATDLPRVHGNAGQLQQVFTNLLLNARDAIPDGGRVTLRTLAEDHDSATVEVEDTGIGIAPENVARIYDPFFTTKGVGRGTGLGLAVSYGIVQEHSGHISVESAPGRGTTFRITLPAAAARTRLQAPSRCGLSRCWSNAFRAPTPATPRCLGESTWTITGSELRGGRPPARHQVHHARRGPGRVLSWPSASASARAQAAGPWSARDTPRPACGP